MSTTYKHFFFFLVSIKTPTVLIIPIHCVDMTFYFHLANIRKTDTLMNKSLRFAQSVVQVGIEPTTLRRSDQLNYNAVESVKF